ncbi:MAG: YggS family pyridoxal phosphate enzyme [Lacipirellulaceae bacterium]
MNPADVIRDNLARVRERIAAAAVASGRPADAVTLVGVSKYVDAATTRLLVEAGCTTLGEARPQALWEKAAAPELAGLGIEWRLIGSLQRNKVARTVPLVTSIDSVDSERLLRAINDASAALGRRTNVLLELHASGEASKHGFAADELRELAPRLADFPHVAARGLMTMAPLEGGVPAARGAFAACRALFVEVGPAPGALVRAAGALVRAAGALAPWDELSMGMSGDFEAAIAEGATHVRVGSALWTGL